MAKLDSYLAYKAGVLAQRRLDFTDAPEKALVWPSVKVASPALMSVIIPLMMKYAHLSFWQSALFVALPAVFLLATAITYLIEKPAMQYIRGLYKGSKQKRLAVS